MYISWVEQDIDRFAMDLAYGADPGPIVRWVLATCKDPEVRPLDKQRLMAALRELLPVPTSPCPRGHGEQEITDFGQGPGLAGGQIYWTDLACGCQDWDESGDRAW